MDKAIMMPDRKASNINGLLG